MSTMGMDALTIDPESDVYQARYALVHDVLVSAGFTDIEARSAFDARLDLEKEILKRTADSPAGKSESASFTIDQLDDLAGEFPLRDLAEKSGYGQAESFEVYNMAQLRGYFICGYVLEADGWLDTKSFDAWLADYAASFDDPPSLAQPERNQSVCETSLNLVAKIAPTLVGRACVEICDLVPVKAFITDLAREAIEAHKKNIYDSQWLSDESKRRLSGKLDAMTLDLVYPDVWEDYSGLDLEGLDYYCALRALWMNDLARNAPLRGRKSMTVSGSRPRSSRAMEPIAQATTAFA